MKYRMKLPKPNVWEGLARVHGDSSLIPRGRLGGPLVVPLTRAFLLSGGYDVDVVSPIIGLSVDECGSCGLLQLVIVNIFTFSRRRMYITSDKRPFIIGQGQKYPEFGGKGQDDLYCGSSP